MEENKLNEDIDRIKSIMNYGSIEEDEMDMTDEPAEDEFSDTEMGDEEMADMDSEEGLEDVDDEFSDLDDTVDDTEMGDVEAPEEDVEEIDITDLVTQVQGISDTLDGMSKSIDTVDARFTELDKNHGVTTQYLDRISDYVANQLGSVNQKLDLMRPPTQQEREKALAQNSYPFNTKVDEYKPQDKKNQTDLEQEKLTVKDMLDDMDVNAVKQSFSRKDDMDTEVGKRFNIPSYRY